MGFVWYFLMTGFRFCISGGNRTAVMLAAGSAPRHVVTVPIVPCSYYQGFTAIAQFRWCLPGFSTVNYCFYFVINEYFIGWYFEKMCIFHFSSNLSLFLYYVMDLGYGFFPMGYMNNSLLVLFTFMLKLPWFGQWELLQCRVCAFLTCSDQSLHTSWLFALRWCFGSFCPDVGFRHFFKKRAAIHWLWDSSWVPLLTPPSIPPLLLPLLLGPTS